MKKQFIACLLLLFAATGCFRGAAPAQDAAARAPVAVPAPDYWPTKGWKTASPESQGMDSGVLAGGIDFIRSEKLNIHSLMVIRNGYVVMDAYFHPFTEGILHELASTTKSFTSTVVGIAMDKGIFKTAQDPIFPILGAGGGAQDSITLDDVLTMRSGLRCVSDETNPALFDEFKHSKSWLGFVTARPIDHTPGSTFCYSNADSHMLSLAVTKAAGRSALAFAEEHLFGPLGIQWYNWVADPQGSSIGYAELKLQPRDMAKLGLLFLQKGMWDGKRVISAGWVDEAVKPRVKIPGDQVFDGYGYQWWSSSMGFYTTRGRGGQFVAVFPGLNMIVVTTAGIPPGEQEKLAVLLKKNILSAVRQAHPLPESPGKFAVLASAVKGVTQPIPAAKRQVHSIQTNGLPLPLAGMLASGRRFVMEKNPLDVAAMTVTFYADSTASRLSMELTDGQKLDLPIGMEGTPFEGRGRYALPAYTGGAWVSDHELEIDFDEVANINRWKITASFAGDLITLTASEPGLGVFTLRGTAGKAE